MGVRLEALKRLVRTWKDFKSFVPVVAGVIEAPVVVSPEDLEVLCEAEPIMRGLAEKLGARIRDVDAPPWSFGLIWDEGPVAIVRGPKGGTPWFRLHELGHVVRAFREGPKGLARVLGGYRSVPEVEGDAWDAALSALRVAGASEELILRVRQDARACLRSYELLDLVAQEWSILVTGGVGWVNFTRLTMVEFKFVVGCREVFRLVDGKLQLRGEISPRKEK